MQDDPPHRAPEEIEWQFDAPDLNRVQNGLTPWAAPDGSIFSLRPKAPVDQRDTYLDTDTWSFHRAGYSLRIRRKGRRTEATLKSIAAPAEGAIRRRTEFNEPLPAGKPVEALPGPVGERVRAVAGRRPVLPLFEIRTHRRTFDLRSNKKLIAEIALDETVLPTGPTTESATEPARLQRVEIESKSPDHPYLKEWVARLWEECGLTPSGASKYESALIAQGVAPGSPPDLGPTAILPSRSISEAAYAVMRLRLRRFMTHEPPARMGEDPEALHDLRVAARRVRAAMSLFEEYVPPRMRRLHDEFGRTTHALGEARDLDVQIDDLRKKMESVAPNEMPARTAILDALHARRREARRRMLEALDSPRQDRVMRSLIHLLTREKPPQGPLAVSIAPDLIRKRYRKLRKAARRIGKNSPPGEYHQVRIRAKRLRYALEFFADLYGDAARRFITRLVELQDLLGSHQDACVAAEQLKSLNAAQGQEMGPEASFLMGDLAAGYAVEATRLRAEFPEVFKGLSKKQFKKLQAVMIAEKRAAPNPDRSEEPPEILDGAAAGVRV